MRFSERGATFSPCRRYRYRLWRTWGVGALDGGRLLFVMLNPSTADAEVFDPTVRRCFGYAQAWGYSHLEVVNLYALRSTDPKGLWAVDDPVGPQNDEHIALSLLAADLVICAWGVNARADRVERFSQLAPEVERRCLGVTKAGAPRHPLYLRKDAKHERWTP